MTLYIKYMVCLRCKLMVMNELKKLGLPYSNVELGVIEFHRDISFQERQDLQESLCELGLDVLEDNKSILVEQIKILVLDSIHHSEEIPITKYSEYISNKLGYDYTYLSNVFSEVKGISIRQYVIINKVERVKELLMYDEFTLTEISYILNYSSVAHLSNQFKKITGLSPSYYRQLEFKPRKCLDEV